MGDSSPRDSWSSAQMNGYTGNEQHLEIVKTWKWLPGPLGSLLAIEMPGVKC